MIEFSTRDLVELKYLWLNKCLSVKEIAEWFGVSSPTVRKQIKLLTVDKAEFDEKNRGFSDFLKKHHGSKVAEKMIHDRKKRLKEIYDRTRHLK